MTITVSPFTGEADICPMNAEWECGYRNLASQQVETVLGTIFFFGNSFHLNWNNFKRFVSMLWMPDPETFMSLVTQGYTDALRFLATRGFIACQLHRNPPLSSFIVRNRERSSYHRLRYRFGPSSPVAASLAPPPRVTDRVAISSEAKASDLGSAYFYSTEVIGAGIGLNVPHCLACQNGLLNALQSRLPTVLRTIIMHHRRPPHQRHGTTSLLRLCTSLLTASRSSLRSGLSHVYTLGRHMFFSMLFQLDVLARLISSLLDFIDGPNGCMRCRSTTANMLDDVKRYLILLRTNSTVSISAEDISSSASAVRSAIPTKTVPQLACPTQSRSDLMHRIQSLITTNTDSLFDFLCALNAVQLPTAKECGLELFSSSLPDLEFHQVVASGNHLSDTLPKGFPVDSGNVDFSPIEYNLSEEEADVHEKRPLFFTGSDAEDEWSSTH
ncbi:unnamed protein product [Dicrocoelium dendriticum]|nr:unnamed protein product [Dicrocoelium dendriticum]CAH8616910.1 unnamed protein product [Dicrocoelium dendriticum]